MTRLDTMVAAYVEAAYFTETGDNGQASPDAELTEADKLRAYFDCRHFLWALDDLADALLLDMRRVGHDLWFTRNGHGVGFWDRPEIYGEVNARWFTRMAHAMGQHDVTFKHEEVEA